jgi:hypothetical protein
MYPFYNVQPLFPF